jgi:pimeloyl-ACP methyl ester carboxylesterase
MVTFLFLLAGGCALLPGLPDGRKAADRVARSGGLEKISIRTRSFPLVAYLRCRAPGDPLNLYIEGDGAAWVSKTRLSDDPTPANPLVLELAGIDPAGNVAYLARPGQYADALGRCDPAYWSDRRFSGEVVAALDEAVDELARKCGSGQIHLIGYSGGAALAVLVAAGRADVVSLRTVAGNLDPAALNRHHRVSPLDAASLDPLDAAEKLRGLPQRHFVGSRDSVVPAFIARSFLLRAGSRDFGRITIVDGATHAEGWRERWRTLLGLPL